MGADFEIFPGFSRPPTDKRLYVKPRVGWSDGRKAASYDPWAEDDEPLPRRSGLTFGAAPDEPPPASYRVCPYCDGDGVSGWDAKDRDIPCGHCEGGVIL